MAEATLIYESSDWHICPEGLPPQVKKWIARGKEEQAVLIGNGDVSEFMYRRWQDFVGSNAVSELDEALGGYPFIYIANNHDPIRYVKKVYGHIPNIESKEQQDLMVGDTLYHFEHGSLFAIDWVVLQKVNAWIASWFPGFWLWWQKIRRKLPRNLKEKAETGVLWKESQKYRDATGIIWRNALKYSLKRSAVVIIGHTHTYAKFEFAKGLVLVDGGDMEKDCDYSRISDQGVHHLSMAV